MEHSVSEEKVSYMKSKKSKAAMRQFLRGGLVKSPSDFDSVLTKVHW